MRRSYALAALAVLLVLALTSATWAASRPKLVETTVTSTSYPGTAQLDMAGPVARNLIAVNAGTVPVYISFDGTTDHVRLERLGQAGDAKALDGILDFAKVYVRLASGTTAAVKLEAW